MGLFDAGRRLMAETGYDDVLDYLRDGLAVGRDVPCKAGQSLYRVDDLSERMTTRLYRQDFMVEASAIPAIDQPEPGDEILWRGRRFLVSAPEGEPCWRWRGPSMTAWRIHAEEEDNAGR